MIAEQSPERDVIVQRKAPKAPKDQLFKIQNVNETVTYSGASGPKSRQKKKAGAAKNEIKVVDYIAEQKGKRKDEILAQGYEIDLHNQQSSSFKDSDSRDERSSQISLVTDKDTVRDPAGLTNSTIIIQPGIPGLLPSQASNTKAEKYGGHGSGVSAHPRKSILPQMDYTNKYVNRHQQSRKDSTDQRGSRKQNNYSIMSSQKSFQGHGSTFNRGENYSTDEYAQSASNRAEKKAMSQMEQISYFDQDNEGIDK